MASTDDRNHSDCHRAKAEIRDIHQKREIVGRNWMKLLGRGHFACCRNWTTWGVGRATGRPHCRGGQGSDFVKTIEENLGLAREYLKGQKKEIETEIRREGRFDLQKDR
jgi:hypothetical protein